MFGFHAADPPPWESPLLVETPSEWKRCRPVEPASSSPPSGSASERHGTPAEQSLLGKKDDNTTCKRLRRWLI